MEALNGNKQKLCEITGVWRNGYYKWLKNSNKPEKDHQEYLFIKEIFEKGKCKFGWRSVQMRLLQEKQIVMNHKKIQRIMRKYHLFAKIRRINPYKQIMKKTQEHRTFENLLARKFEQDTPFKVFSTDITYLPYNHRMAYLSVIKDVATGEVVGWNLSQHIDMDIVLHTITRMKDYPIFQTISLKNILIHSDQGVHYTHPSYINALKELGMVQSMSRKGNCIDNAPIESFFGHLKDDMDFKQCKTFEELKLLTTEQMDYYNNYRYQWDLKKMTPVGYRNHLLSAI